MVAGIMASGNGTVNRESRLLTREENDQVCRMLGTRCEALASSVIQLFTTDPPDHGSWVKRDAGVLCVIKDHLKRSYFLRLYCLARRGLVWEHEIYNSMEYNAPRPFLHTFEGQDCIVGFNFASEDDARVIQNVILQKLDRKQRRMERKSRSSYTTSRHSSTPPYSLPPQPMVNKAPVMNGMNPPPSRQVQPLPHTNSNFGASARGRGGAGGKRKFTKADIGLPSDFRHVSHVGWDPNKGFDLDNVEDPQLKHFFVKAGVSDSQLQDPETREFIYDFINQHGGLDAVKEDTTTHQPPPVPARVIPHPPPPHHRSGSEARVAPPPPPSRGPPPVLPSTPPVATHHPPPPPPPSLRTLPNRGENLVQAGAPPPPPPPPPPAAPMPPPDLPATFAPRDVAPDPRNALMDAIRSAKPLKRVETDTKRPPSVGDTRTDLLDQIRGGIELKAVQHVPKPAPDVGEANTLAGALARALQERSRAIHSDSDSPSSGSEDDDEWED